jgi:O-antigen/teichoic acid export membrane protein
VTDIHSNEELTAAAATGVRWTTVVRVVTEVLLLGSMIVLARLIPPSAFGMFAVAIIVQELAVTVPSEGVGSALVQRRSVDRAHLQGGFALALLVGAGLTLVTLALAAVVVNPIFGFETARLVALTTPWFMLGAIVALPLTILRRRLEFGRVALLGLVQSVVRAGSSIFFAAALGLDAEALVFGGVLGMFAMVAAALVLAPVPLPRWRGRAVRDLLPYGGPAMLACFSWVGFRNGDYAIVGARLGAAQAGFYWRGFQLAVEYQGKLSGVMNQVAFPVLSRTASMEDLFAMRRRMVRTLTVGLFPLLAALVVLAPVIVPWLFGPAWEPAVVPTQILAGAGAATVVIDAVGSVLMATGRTRAMLLYGVAHFAVYVAAILFASRYGLTAVCVAAVSIHLVFAVVAYSVLLRGRAERTLRFFWDDVGAATVSCVALVAVAVPVNLALDRADLAPVLQLLIVSGVAAAVYLSALRIGFPAAFRDLRGLMRRVVPVRRLGTALRRVVRPRRAASSAAS